MPPPQFVPSILAGLQAQPKQLPSAYFYDQQGSELFRRIMQLPSYYLSRCEAEVISRHAPRIAEQCRAERLVVVDLGAGDGSKTRPLLDALARTCSELIYAPVDISADALQGLGDAHRARYPALPFDPVVGEYTTGIELVGKRYPKHRRLALFLGSNIGNLAPAEAISLLSTWRASLGPGDSMLLGFDLLKDPEVLQLAYADPQGVTAAFNLNLLARMNRELGANFDLGAFRHFARFDARRCAMESYLLSTREQVVNVAGSRIAFAAWEPIHTEISCKYRESDVLSFARASGFSSLCNYYDERRYFLDALWRTDGVVL